MSLTVAKATTRRPTAKAQTNRLKTRVIKTNLSPDEGARFDDLVKTSCLSQAEYIRRACLRQKLNIVPDQNLVMYAKLGTFQKAAQTVLRVGLPVDVREQLEATLADLKALRLLLIDVDPDAVTEPATATVNASVPTT